MRESSQPCQLPLREVPGPHARAPHGFRPIDLSREQGDHLGVAGTLQGGRSDSSGGEQALGLLDEAAGEHALDTLVDARAQHLPRQIDDHQPPIEPRLWRRCEVARERAARDGRDLERPHDASQVALVDASRRRRVDRGEPPVQGRCPVSGRLRLQGCADAGVGSRQRRQPVAEGLQIQGGASDEEDPAAASAALVRRPGRIGQPPRDAVRLLR